MQRGLRVLAVLLLTGAVPDPVHACAQTPDARTPVVAQPGSTHSPRSSYLARDSSRGFVYAFPNDVFDPSRATFRIDSIDHQRGGQRLEWTLFGAVAGGGFGYYLGSRGAGDLGAPRESLQMLSTVVFGLVGAFIGHALSRE